MPGDSVATLFVGNLDDKVDERILYEIMIQAGPLLHVYIPRDKETKRHKGYGFAEYASEKSAQYALNLFPGLVTLHNKHLRFAISGMDKPVNSKDKSPQLNIVRAKEVEDTVISRPVDTSPQFQRNYPPMPITPVNHPSMSASYNYSGHPISPTLLGHGPYLSQNYNARLVSLGQMGLRNQLPNRGNNYSYPSY